MRKIFTTLFLVVILLTICSFVKAQDTMEVYVPYDFKEPVTITGTRMPSSSGAVGQVLKIKESGVAGWENSGTSETTIGDYADLTPQVTLPEHREGRFFYDDNKKAMSYYNEEDSVEVNIAQENLIRVYNENPYTIQNLQACYVYGTSGTNQKVGKADAKYKEKATYIAVATHDIEAGTYGYVTTFGEVSGNTTAFSAADDLYIDVSKPLSLTNTEPDDGNYPTLIGKVITSAVDGKIFVYPVVCSRTSEVNDTNGFSPNQRTATDMVFHDATRTFGIGPNSTEFAYYIEGKKYIHDDTDSVVIDDTTGLHVVYYDGDTLVSAANPSGSEVSSVIRTKAIVAYVYWNSTTGHHYYIGDERHGMNMDPTTHNYLHFNMHVRYVGVGLGLSDILPDQTGDLNTHAQFGVETGSLMDEDLYHTISTVASTTGLPIWYRSGADGAWIKTSNSGFSIMTAGTGRMAYNQWTGATWQLTEVTNNDYALCHVFANNSYDSLPFSIVGQNTYATVALARAGANAEINNLALSSLPSEETKPIATIIFQTSTGYANSVKSRILTTSDGANYVDWRSAQIEGGSAPTSHSLLTDLQVDTHLIYLPVDGSRPANLIKSLGDITAETSVVLKQVTTPSDIPSVGYGKLYTKADGKVYIMTIESGEVQLGSGTGSSIDETNILHKDSAETIISQKDFLVSPLVPTPSTDFQAATKKYVDDNIVAGGTSEVFIEGTQGVQVQGNTIVFRNAGVERSANTIYIDCPDASSGTSPVTFDRIGVNEYSKFIEIDRSNVPTPGTGEVNIFVDSVSHEPAIKNWLGKVYGLVLESLEDIPFYFHTGSYTDYNYNGTYGTNWNASSTSIFNVDDLVNPSGSPYALTLQTKVTRLVDISSITPSGFVVEYGPYDAGGIKYGLIGNGGVVYSCLDTSEIIDCTQNTSTDFLAVGTWTESDDDSRVTVTETSVSASYSGSGHDGVYSVQLPKQETIVIFKYTSTATASQNGGRISFSGSNMTTPNSGLHFNGIGGVIAYYINWGNDFGSYAHNASTSYWVKFETYNYATSTYSMNIYISTSEKNISDDWGSPTYNLTGNTHTNKHAIQIMGYSGTAINISNLSVYQQSPDVSGEWKKINDLWEFAQERNKFLNTEAQVSIAIDNFKTDTSATLLGPYVSMTSGTTGEIESINISY